VACFGFTLIVDSNFPHKVFSMFPQAVCLRKQARVWGTRVDAALDAKAAFPCVWGAAFLLSCASTKLFSIRQRVLNFEI